MPKFEHINSIADIDKEIAKIELTKKVLRSEMSSTIESVKDGFKPLSIGIEIINLLFHKSSEKKSDLALLVIRVLSYFEISKYAGNWLKKIFN